MEIAMADMAEFCFSDRMSDEPIDVGWSDWSHIIGWAPGFDDVKWNSTAATSDEYGHAGSSSETLEHWSSSISDAPISSSVGTPVEDPPKPPCTGEIDKGIRLIHLLSAAGEALSDYYNGQQLARVILARLKQLLTPATGVDSTGTVRLVSHFTNALSRLVDDEGDEFPLSETIHCSATEVASAMQLLQDMSPYVNFGYFTANQAILEAFAGERRVHVVDFDIGEGAQWAPLIQAFMSTKGSSPAPSHFKITAVSRGRKSAASTVVKETGRRLAAFAASVGLPFSFAQSRLDREGCFRPEAVRLIHGEPIVFNCAIHQPHHLHHPPNSIESFLAGAAKMGARVVTVVEEDKGRDAANGGRFFGRFMEQVQRYSAMWDALEAGFPQQGMVRETVENVVFAPRIASAVEMAFFQRQETPAVGFADKMMAAGFRGLALSFFNLLQAKLMLGIFNEGYHVEEAEQNKLVLCWKSRRLVSVSIWSCLQPPPPPPPAEAETQKF